MNLSQETVVGAEGPGNQTKAVPRGSLSRFSKPILFLTQRSHARSQPRASIKRSLGMKIANAALSQEQAMPSTVRMNQPAAVIVAREAHCIQPSLVHPRHDRIHAIVRQVPRVQKHSAKL